MAVLPLSHMYQIIIGQVLNVELVSTRLVLCAREYVFSYEVNCLLFI